MKRFLILLAALLLLTVPAMADDLPEDAPEAIPTEAPADPVTIDTTTTKEGDGVIVNVTIAQPEAVPDSSVESGVSSSEEAVVSSEEDLSAVRSFSVYSPDVLETLQSLDGSTVMADVVTAVLGEYQRQTYTVQQLDNEGNVIATSTEFVPGLAGLDYPWIAGAVLFALLLVGVLRLLGGLIRL